ncbi:MAG: LTA synthase family protein [Alphaproteobacteria bacterium]|jgi:phosphoglycerol transferase|nr:LTA synthase family protein [Alphaproteobacteria bacterium]
MLHPEVFMFLIIFLLIEIMNFCSSISFKNIFVKEGLIPFFRLLLSSFFIYIIESNFLMEEFKLFFPIFLFLILTSGFDFYFRMKGLGKINLFKEFFLKNKFLFYILLLFLLISFLFLIKYSFITIDFFVLAGCLYLLVNVKFNFVKIISFLLILLIIYFNFTIVSSYMFLGKLYSKEVIQISKIDILNGLFTGYKWLLYVILFYAIYVISFLKKLFLQKVKFNNRKKLNSLLVFCFVVFSIFFTRAFASLLSTTDLDSKSRDDALSLSKVDLSVFNDVKFDKNLVMIYLESFSTDFVLKYKNSTPFLNSLLDNKNSIFYKNYLQKESATRRGIKSSSCGYNSSNGVYCLGDFLNEKGYEQTFLGGAKLSYSQKGKLFKRHKFDNLLGKNKLENLYGKKSLLSSGWGVSDEYLFKHTLDIINSADENGELFNITALTLDTHDENIYSSVCDREIELVESGKNTFLKNIRCTDYLLSRFFVDIKSKKFFENTVFVLIGDHPFRRSDKLDIPLDDNRTFFMILNAKPVEDRINSEIIYPKDVMPIILNNLSN